LKYKKWGFFKILKSWDTEWYFKKKNWNDYVLDQLESIMFNLKNSWYGIW
jgi:hypothetical protein